MAQVGVLGDLKYDPAVHSWALDLGSWFTYVGIFSIISSPADAAADHRLQAETIHSINTVLELHEIHYAVPQIRQGVDIDMATIESKLLALLEKKDEALGAFFLIGAAGCFLDLAHRLTLANKLEQATKQRRRARNRIDRILRLSLGIKVNPTALYDMLAQPPYGDLELRTRLQRASQPLVILFLAADPRDAVRRDLQGEQRTLKAIVQSTIVHNAFKVVDAPGCRIEDISQALLLHKPVLLHFSGHGTPNGEFCFEDAQGKTAIVNARAFANLLALAHEDGLRGAVMNAGYADTDAQLLANATGYAVAMKGQLSDGDANTFTREFYRALGSGKSVDNAFRWAVAGAGIDPNAGGLCPRIFRRDTESPIRTSPSDAESTRTSQARAPFITRMTACPVLVICAAIVLAFSLVLYR